MVPPWGPNQVMRAGHRHSVTRERTEHLLLVALRARLPRPCEYPWDRERNVWPPLSFAYQEQP